MKLASMNSPSLFFPFVKIRLVFNFCRCTPPLKFLMANFSRITVFTSENTFVWEYDKSKNLLIGPHKVLLVCSGCPCQTGNFSYVYNGQKYENFSVKILILKFLSTSQRDKKITLNYFHMKISNNQITKLIISMQNYTLHVHFYLGCINHTFCTSICIYLLVRACQGHIQGACIKIQSAEQSVQS